MIQTSMALTREMTVEKRTEIRGGMVLNRRS